MAHTLLTAEIHLDLPAPYRVVGGVVREGLSQRTHATVEIASVHDLDLRTRLAEAVVLEIGGLEDRRWTLQLGSAALLDEKDGSYRYRLELYDALWMLGLSKNTRKYRNQSARQIASQVLDEHGVAHIWQTSEETPIRKYCAQYDETNLAFVERLLESEGIYYSFDQQGTLLLGDRSASAPRLSQPAPWTLISAGSALDHGDVGIFELFSCARVQSGGTTLGDYSWKTPAVLLRQSAFDEVDADLERYSYPAGFRKPEQGQRLAKLRLEALRADARTLEGRSSVPRFQPAVGFAFDDDLGEQFAGEFVLIEVEHRFRHHELDALCEELTEVAGYWNRFRAIPRAVPFRPPLRTPRPTVSGSHTAMVRGPGDEEIHTDAHGRFRAQLHWDREAVGSDEDSRWLRKLQEVSSGMTLARAGWEMYVNYIDGDPDRPIGVGRAINGEAVPAYQLPGNMNVMSMKTPSSPATGGFSELKLDDSAGSQLFYMKAEKDYDGTVKRNQTVTIGNDELHTVGTDLTRQITGSQTCTVGANNAQTIGENLKLNVQGSATAAIGGSMEVKLASGATIRIACNDTEIVGGLRLTLAGSFTTPDLSTLAKSAAERFLRTASPGGASLYDKAQEYKDLPEQLEQLPDRALAKAKGYVDQLKNWPESYLSQVKDQLGKEAAEAFEKAFKEAYDAKKDDDKIGGAIDGVKAGVESALDAVKDGVVDLPAETKDAAIEQLKGIAEDLKGMIPSLDDIKAEIDGLKKDLETLLPTEATLQDAFKQGLSTLTDGLSDKLLAGDWEGALDQAIDMFCSGGIARNVQYLTLKAVGGAYVTASVQPTEWTVGQLYAETVGGVKLTAALDDIKQDVTGLHTVTVGGAMMRAAGGAIEISAAASTVNVGAAASIESGGKISITAPSVGLEGAASVVLHGGGAEAKLSPGSITFTGNLKLAAVGDIVVSGGKVDVT